MSAGTGRPVDRTVHSHRLESGEWWACQFPERPFDPDGTWFAADCRSCVLALGASAAARPEQLIGWSLARIEMSIAEAYAVCRLEHGLPELPTVEGND